MTQKILSTLTPALCAITVLCTQIACAQVTATTEGTVASSAQKSTWFPFMIPWDDAPNGSITDMSVLNVKPAGKNGRIVAKGPHLFEQGTGKRVRFFGTNLGAAAAFVTKEQAEKAAARLAKLGFNLVRMHHLNNGWDNNGGNIWKKGRNHIEIDPVQVDKLDYFIAQLIKNGIYVNMNLQTSREMVPELGFPESVKEVPNFQKKLDKFNRKMIALQKDYAKDLLDRINPYLGRKYKDEPGLMVIEINNENSIAGWPGESIGAGLGSWPEPFKSDMVLAWNEWLQNRYKDDAGLSRAWPAEENFTGPSLVSKNNVWTHENQNNSDVKYEVLENTGTAGSSKTIRVVLNGHVGPNWHLQAHLGGLDLKNGQTYTVAIKVKADRKVAFGIDSRLSKPDWRFLGLGGTVEAGPEWKTYTYSFNVINTEPNSTRIGFVLGDIRGKATVEIADISIIPGTKTTGVPDGESLAKMNVSFPPASSSPNFRDWSRFIVETETNYSNEMRSYLVDTLGFKAALILDTQVQWGGLTSLVREEKMSFSDAHAYWNHPAFLGAEWDPQKYRVNRVPMTETMGASNGELGTLAMWRRGDRPFSVSEYNHPAPSDFQVEMMPLYANFAAFQDWDIIYTFSYDSTKPFDRYDNYFDTGANPAKAAYFPSTALLFRTGLLEKAVAASMLRIPKEIYLSTNQPGSLWGTNGGTPNPLTTAIAMIPTDGEKVMRMDNRAAPLSPFSVTSGIGGKVFVTDGVNVKSVVGYVGGTTLSLKNASFKFGRFGYDFAALTLVAKDGKPMTESKSALLTLAARVENTDMQWNAERDSVSDQWGKAPIIAEVVPVTVSVKTKATMVFALLPNGNRSVKVPSTVKNGTLTFTLDGKGKSLWYELTTK